MVTSNRLNRKVPPPSPLKTVSEPDLNRLPSVHKTTATPATSQRRRSLTGGCTPAHLPAIQVPSTPSMPALKSNTSGLRSTRARPSRLLPPTPFSCASPSTRGDAPGGAHSDPLNTTTPKSVRFETSAIAKKSTSRFVKGSSRLNGKLNYNLFESKIVRKQELESHLQAFSEMKVGKDGNVTIQEFIRHLEKHDPALLKHANSIYSTLSPGGRPLNFRALVHGLYPAAKPDDVEALTRIAMSNSSKRRPISPPVRGVPSKRDVQYAMDVYHFWNKSGTGRLSYLECEAGLVQVGLNDRDIDNALDEMFSNESSTVSLRNFTVWFAACMFL